MTFEEMAKGSSIYDLDSGTPRWFAVQTRSKSEKFVVRMLQKKGITCYLPLMKIMRKYSRSKRLVENR
ncbi:MAG: transcription termination/antitermination NusG family protein [Saprospiraceae bacterium]